MKKSVLIGILLSALAAPSARATIGDSAPANPCGGAAYKGKGLAILDVSGDGGIGGGCPGNGVWAETAITCTSKEKTGNNIDVAIEYYDSGGNLISGALVVGTNAWCGAIPGDTFTFYTDPSGGLTAPWVAPGGVPAFPIATTPVVPGAGATCLAGTAGCFAHGSARVLSTSTKIQCSATRIDFSGPCSAGLPVPVASKNLTIIKSPAQKGD
jgi:hypothetical protein